MMRELLLFILFWAFGNSVFAQTPFPAEKDHPPSFEDIISYKETMKFEVKYGFFKLGWVEVDAIRDTLVNGNERYFMRATIRSNTKVPFVGTEIDYHNSVFLKDAEGNIVTEHYWKDNVDEDYYKEVEYIFERDIQKVIYKGEKGKRDTLELEDPATAGLLILLYSRMNAGSERSYEMPVYVSRKRGLVYADNSKEKKKRKSPAFEGRIEAYYSRGQADLNGPFGFSGAFDAWYLADDLRVPLEAHFKVFLGNVKLRLIEYNRTPL